jgi:hypothetical protein
MKSNFSQFNCLDSRVSRPRYTDMHRPTLLKLFEIKCKVQEQHKTDSTVQPKEDNTTHNFGYCLRLFAFRSKKFVQ